MKTLKKILRDPIGMNPKLLLFLHQLLKIRRIRRLELTKKLSCQMVEVKCTDRVQDKSHALGNTAGILVLDVEEETMRNLPASRRILRFTDIPEVTA
jgi:hypothetical protein